MSKYSYANPDMFYLFFVLIPIIAWYIYRQKKFVASLQVSTLKNLEAVPKNWKFYLRHLIFALKVAVISLLIIVLARPQSAENWRSEEHTSELQSPDHLV